ncbi:hypothetical protein [Priestia sp. YIM B13490]|uniref:hypothetical protein n=1 Tax=Priestia sp. YIM B13490 TaxID=3366310 RepID=UPI003670C237
MEHTLKGNGSVKFDKGLELTGDFFIEGILGEIWNKRQNLLSLNVKDNSVNQHLNDFPFFPWVFEGTSRKGIVIKANGMALTKHGYSTNEQGQLTNKFSFSILEIIVGDASGFDYVEFLIPNFLIGFDILVKQGDKQIRNMTSFTLEYNEIAYSLELIGVNNPIAKKNEIISNNKDLVTVQLKVKRANGRIDYEEAKEVVELVLELCTVAYGGRVSWGTCFGILDENKSFQIFRDVPFAPLKPSRQLMPVNLYHVLSGLIINCFPLYSKLDNEQRLNFMKLIEGIHLSTLQLVFPAPFVNLGSIIEEFTNLELEEKITHFVGKTDRRALLPKFKAFIEEDVMGLLDESDKIYFEEGELKQKLSGLLGRTLRSRIISLMDSFELEYEEDLVGQFVKKRNAAAHGTYKYTTGDYQIFSTMAALLERIALMKIQYKGQFLDWSTSPPEHKNM